MNPRASHRFGQAAGLDPGPVFAALADPTRREIVGALLAEGATSVPTLTARLPISRQAVAKHLAALDAAGLVERDPATEGREVRYLLRGEALAPASDWIASAESAWNERLRRLKRHVDG